MNFAERYSISVRDYENNRDYEISTEQKFEHDAMKNGILLSCSGTNIFLTPEAWPEIKRAIEELIQQKEQINGQ